MEFYLIEASRKHVEIAALAVADEGASIAAVEDIDERARATRIRAVLTVLDVNRTSGNETPGYRVATAGIDLRFRLSGMP